MEYVYLELNPSRGRLNISFSLRAVSFEKTAFLSLKGGFTLSKPVFSPNWKFLSSYIYFLSLPYIYSSFIKIWIFGFARFPPCQFNLLYLFTADNRYSLLSNTLYTYTRCSVRTVRRRIRINPWDHFKTKSIKIYNQILILIKIFKYYDKFWIGNNYS